MPTFQYDHTKFRNLPGPGDCDAPEPDELTDDEPDTIAGTDPKRLRIRPRPTLRESLRIALGLPPTDPAPAEEMTDLRTLLRVTEA